MNCKLFCLIKKIFVGISASEGKKAKKGLEIVMKPFPTNLIFDPNT